MCVREGETGRESVCKRERVCVREERVCVRGRE